MKISVNVTSSTFKKKLKYLNRVDKTSVANSFLFSQYMRCLLDHQTPGNNPHQNSRGKLNANQAKKLLSSRVKRREKSMIRPLENTKSLISFLGN